MHSKFWDYRYRSHHARFIVIPWRESRALHWVAPTSHVQLQAKEKHTHELLAGEETPVWSDFLLC
ncbi:rCG23052 [Rattus norvegicus]|uniref:RCG23052 n=1 Tax=Rattus norvegicus TaxID=10116 RepID=A6KN40_RAT|nr:rCG23052 [Rattus norvegicus]